MRLGAGLRRTVGDLFPAALRCDGGEAVDIREEDEEQMEQRRRVAAEDTQSSDNAERRNVSRTALTGSVGCKMAIN